MVTRHLWLFIPLYASALVLTGVPDKDAEPSHKPTKTAHAESNPKAKKKVAKPQAYGPGGKDLRNTTFDDYVFGSGKDVLVQFWAPWCPTCKKFAPQWSMVYDQRISPLQGFATVDCVRDKPLCRRWNVTKYPTVLYYSMNTTRFGQMEQYPARKTYSSMMNWLKVQQAARCVMRKGVKQGNCTEQQAKYLLFVNGKTTKERSNELGRLKQMSKEKLLSQGQLNYVKMRLHILTDFVFQNETYSKKSPAKSMSSKSSKAPAAGKPSGKPSGKVVGKGGSTTMPKTKDGKAAKGSMKRGSSQKSSADSRKKDAKSSKKQDPKKVKGSKKQDSKKSKGTGKSSKTKAPKKDI